MTDFLLGRPLEDLKAGSLRIECPSMRLFNGDDEAPGHFTGPGEIYFTDHGQLELVLYDQEYDAAASAEFSATGTGSWVPRTDLFDLAATDLAGSVWTASDLRPSTNAYYGRPGAVVRARLPALRADWTASRDGRDFAWLYFDERIATPSNVATVTTTQEGEGPPRRGFRRDVWEISCCGDLETTLRRGDTGFEVNVLSPPGSLASGIDTRIQEALWFALGQPLTADVVQCRRGDDHRVVIYSRGRHETVRYPSSPYYVDHLDSAGPLGQMFCDYLEFVAGMDDERYHPLSVLLRKVILGADGTVEDSALAASVGVEGLLRLGFPALGEPTNETLEAISDAEAALSELLKTSPLSDRLKGFIGAVRRPNPRSALRELAGRGVVSDLHVKAWERTRHVAAHGQEFEIPVRELYELTVQVRVLFNLLVFDLVGYVGPYTDYGAKGWPTRTVGDDGDPESTG